MIAVEFRALAMRHQKKRSTLRVRFEHPVVCRSKVKRRQARDHFNHIQHFIDVIVMKDDFPQREVFLFAKRY